MLSILDQPDLRARIGRLSVEEYHRLGDREGRIKGTELIRGIIIDKMSKSPLHGSIATILQRLLMPMLPAGYCWRREEPLTLADSEPEPDFAVVTGRTEDYLAAHPKSASLVAEVAVTTADADRILAGVYAEAGVGEYWIVLPQECVIEVYRSPERGEFREMRRYSRGEEINCTTLTGVRLAVSELFAALP